MVSCTQKKMMLWDLTEGPAAMEEVTWPVKPEALGNPILRVSPCGQVILATTEGAREFAIVAKEGLQAAAKREIPSQEGISVLAWGWSDGDSESAAFLAGNSSGDLIVHYPDRSRHQTFQKKETTLEQSRNRLASLKR